MPSKWKALARRAEGHEPKGKKSARRKGRSRNRIVVPLVVMTFLVSIFAVVAYSLIMNAKPEAEVVPTVTAEITATPAPGELREPTAAENTIDELSGTILNLVPFIMVFAIGVPIVMRIFTGGRD